MKKKKTTLALLILSLGLILVGLLLSVISLGEERAVNEGLEKEPENQFDRIEINLSDCSLTILPAERTYVCFYGYHESDLSFDIADRTLVLSDDLTLWDKIGLGDRKITLEGLGRYIRQSRTLAESQEVFLYLSEEDQKKNTQITLKNSSLKLSSPLSDLTLRAEASQVVTENFAFRTLSCQLDNCQSSFYLAFERDTFSRYIETYDTFFTQDDRSDANADYFFAGNLAPSFKLVAYGGSCELITKNKE